MMLPIEGAAALHKILGILSDHEVQDVDGRLDALDRRLVIAWSSEEWASICPGLSGVFRCPGQTLSCSFADFGSLR